MRPGRPGTRRRRYAGKNPRAFQDRYKELNPERYAPDVEKILASGRTPAGTHRPIMVAEVLRCLRPEPGEVAIDCTLGGGGHARALLERVLPGGRVIGLDVDPAELPRTEAQLRSAGFGPEAFVARQGNYAGLSKVLAAEGLPSADMVLADLGVSSMQLDAPGRGFSFRRDEPLDMRMDPTTGPSAEEAIRDVDERTLADVIFTFGEERFSRRIARAIVHARAAGGIRTTGQLAALVRQAVPRKGYSRIDPATRTFQAIRIWVNRELEGLDAFLAQAADRLNAGGRLAVITFHSLEDRIVKHTFRALQSEGRLAVRTKRPLVPGEAEIERNPRARSAKLRAAERPDDAGLQVTP
jgi:16S rRNA (cytosine1402-N4)-methyltransferase